MLPRLQPYDITIKYRPGKQMQIADALSRLSPEDLAPIDDLNVQIQDIHCMPTILRQVLAENPGRNSYSVKTLSLPPSKKWCTTVGPPQ